MEQNLMTLNYSGKPVRTVVRDGEPWWVLVDVCTVLGLLNASAVVQRLDDDERAKFDLGRQGKTWIINESGLYSVLLRSDKPEAKPFKRWVTHEVLPSIRKTGKYAVTQEKPKKLVCDVPGNAAACQIMQEMTKSATAIQVLVEGYKRYFWTEQERAGYADAIISICQRLYMKSDELARLKYNMVEKNW